MKKSGVPAKSPIDVVTNGLVAGSVIVMLPNAALATPTTTTVQTASSTVSRRARVPMIRGLLPGDADEHTDGHATIGE